MKTFLLAAILGIFLTGCSTNPLAKFYQDYTKQMPVALQQRLLPPNGNPQIISIAPNQHKIEAHQLEEKGYLLIGVAAFNGPAITQSQLNEQAKRTSAGMVVVSSQFLGNQQGVRPIFTYQPGQTYITSESGTFNANVYNNGGYASGFGTYSGSATTTSSGTLNTQYVPYEYSIYGTAASFWRHVKPPVFGAGFDSIPEDMRTKLQRNRGAYINTIVQDSPAFKANILEGDVIIQIADKSIMSNQDFLDSLPTYAGQKVPIKLIRNGQTLNFNVQLNNAN
jgi:hypothetical protein